MSARFTGSNSSALLSACWGQSCLPLTLSLPKTTGPQTCWTKPPCVAGLSPTPPVQLLLLEESFQEFRCGVHRWSRRRRVEETQEPCLFPAPSALAEGQVSRAAPSGRHCPWQGWCPSPQPREHREVVCPVSSRSPCLPAGVRLSFPLTGPGVGWGQGYTTSGHL